jgi:hypothetical protein
MANSGVQQLAQAKRKVAVFITYYLRGRIERMYLW